MSDDGNGRLPGASGIITEDRLAVDFCGPPADAEADAEAAAVAAAEAGAAAEIVAEAEAAAAVLELSTSPLEGESLDEELSLRSHARTVFHQTRWICSTCLRDEKCLLHSGK